MAILKLTDIAGGKMEGVIFPEAYEKVKHLLFPNAPAILVGKVNRKDEELQLIVNEAIAIDPNSKYTEGAIEIESEYIVLIELPLIMANDEIKTQELKTILGEYSGDTSAIKTPVYAIVRGEHDYQLVRFGKQFWIQDPTMLADRMELRGFHFQVKSLESNSDSIE
jgi:DNA polymerase-3 subunit alpha